MTKKAVFSSLLLLSIFANAQEFNTFEKSYLKESDLKAFSPDLASLIKHDDKYNLAIKQLIDEQYMAKQEVASGDPHDINAQKAKTIITVPNFKEALKNLKESYANTTNPLSAYVAMHIIKTAFGKNTSLEDFAKYSKVLYDNKLCTGFLDYGETVEKGYFQTADKKRALAIYKEGFEKCKDMGWYANVLSAKILSTK